MRAGQTLVAQEEREANVSDLKLPAINAERLTLYRSSRQRAGQCYAVIALARIAPRKREPKRSSAS